MYSVFFFSGQSFGYGSLANIAAIVSAFGSDNDAACHCNDK
jgi:hypothetical protein